METVTRTTIITREVTMDFPIDRDPEVLVDTTITRQPVFDTVVTRLKNLNTKILQ